MFNGMTPDRLRDVLAAVGPADLKGLALLQRRRPRPGRWFPAETSPRRLAEAATEMMDYMQSCQRASKRLQALRPVPLDAPVEEWPL
jgi:hypothetical protein